MLKKHTEISLSLPLKGQQLHSSVFCNSKNIKCSVAARSAGDGKFSPFEIIQALIYMLPQTLLIFIIRSTACYSTFISLDNPFRAIIF